MTRVTATAREVGLTLRPPIQPVTEFRLDNGEMQIAVWTYGATLVEVAVDDGAGDRLNLILRLNSLQEYEDPVERAYIGSTMGRFARIVAQGQAPIAGSTHHLSRNAGTHHIHGGHEGFDARTWKGQAIEGPGRGRIIMTLDSADKEEGYPGNVTCTAIFELDTANRLTVTYEATTDKPTVCDLTTHAFWNLAGSGTINDLVLELHSPAFIEDNADHVPTGRVIPVANSTLDFQLPRALGSTAIDKCFALTPSPQAVQLFDPRSGRSMVVTTDQPGLAVYTGDFLPVPRAGICFQPGAWPDAPNHPDFPSAELQPGQRYFSRSTYAFDHKAGGSPGD